MPERVSVALYGAPGPPPIPTGKANVAEAAHGEVVIDEPVVVKGAEPNAGAVIARMRSGFRLCYRRALAIYPDVAGTIRLSINVADSGRVAGVSGPFEGKPNVALLQCIRNRALDARFTPPPSGTALVTVKIHLDP